MIQKAVQEGVRQQLQSVQEEEQQRQLQQLEQQQQARAHQELRQLQQLQQQQQARAKEELRQLQQLQQLQQAQAQEERRQMQQLQQEQQSRSELLVRQMQEQLLQQQARSQQQQAQALQQLQQLQQRLQQLQAAPPAPAAAPQPAPAVQAPPVNGVQLALYQDLEAASENFSPGRRLGQGCFGHVYRGTWRGIQVAIKRQEQHPDMTEESVRQAFQREVDTALVCRHANLIPILAASVTPPLCIVYPLMANGALDVLLAARPAELTAAIRLRIGVDLATGLSFLHSDLEDKPSHIHRDVKSANVLVDEAFRARLADFGLARRIDLRRTTVAGVGTATHQAPEILRLRPHTTNSDVFSMGVVLMELLTGLPPADEHADEPLLYHRLGDQLPQQAGALAAAQANFNHDVAFQLGNIISRCIAHAPAQRPPAAVVEQELSTMVARLPPPPEQARRECTVCVAAERQVLLLPCRHFIMCARCTELVRGRGTAAQPALCPHCREPIRGTQQGGLWRRTYEPE